MLSTDLMALGLSGRNGRRAAFARSGRLIGTRAADCRPRLSSLCPIVKSHPD